jgi:hypothetical protein
MDQPHHGRRTEIGICDTDTLSDDLVSSASNNHPSSIAVLDGFSHCEKRQRGPLQQLRPGALGTIKAQREGSWKLADSAKLKKANPRKFAQQRDELREFPGW